MPGLPAAVLGEIAVLIARVEALADAIKRVAGVGRRESGRLRMIA